MLEGIEMTTQSPSKPNAFGASLKKLSDLQRPKVVVQEGEVVQKIHPDRIECKPQIRTKNNPGFSHESLMELGADIEVNGQEQPAIVRRHPDPSSGFDFLMVAGERRHRSCKLKDFLLDCLVRDLTDEQARRIQRSENIQREGLTQVEIALALLEDKEKYGTLQAVADEWNKGLNWVAERLKFLDLMAADGVAREAFDAGITADITVINDLGRLERLDPVAAKRVVKKAEEDIELNVREEVRTELREAKKIRGVPNSPKKDKAPSTELELANEKLAVMVARVKTLEDEVEYLKQELATARQQLGQQWKPEQ